MNRSSFLSSPAVRRLARAAPLAAGLALAAAVIPAGIADAAPATLPANCAQSGATVTCSYGYTGGEQTFTVPAGGITSVQVVARGAAGSANQEEQPGGEGAQVTGTLGGLSPGQVLYVEVGQTVDTASLPEEAQQTAFNGGGAGYGIFSGAGGGASDVRAISSAAAGSLASRLIVAGGGGGHSETYDITVPPANAGENGQPATAQGIGGQGGLAGTQTAGGAGGQAGPGDVPALCIPGRPGTAGSLGQGGNGRAGTPSSAGGGGGLYGGGGGGSSGLDAGDSGTCGSDAAGGGGGGSSLVPAGGSQALTTSPASVTISYTLPVTATATALSSSANPSVAGQQVTYTATVSPVPDGGTVAFTDGAVTIGGCGAVPVDTSTGTAVCQATYASSGSHSITAGYSGDVLFEPSTSAPLSQTVGQASTATTVTSSANPSVSGQSVTFVATVSPVSPGAGSPTGTVTFSDGGTLLGTEGLNGSGTATFTTSTLAAGGHQITAAYGGDANFAASSGSLTQTVSKIVTATAVASSANPSIPGQAVTYTATVSPAPDGGLVAFTDGGTAIAGCAAQPLNSSGQATCQVTYTATGSHAITAVYSGDAVYAGSTSAPLTQSVVPDRADLKVGVSVPSQAADGSSVTETVTVTNQGPATASKVVTVLTDPPGLTVTNAGGARVTGSVLTWTTASLAPGASETFTATVQVGTHAKGVVAVAAGALSATPDPDLLNNAAVSLTHLG